MIVPSVMVAVQPVSRVVVQLGSPSTVTQSLLHFHRSVIDPLIVPASRLAVTCPDKSPGFWRYSEFQPVSSWALSRTMLVVVRFHNI